MNNVWVGTDWHLWSVNSVTDKRHQFRSISNLGRLSAAYAEDIQSDDIFIYLGDLCDPGVTDIKKLKAIVSSIPGYKVLCKGNHDTQDDTFYKEIGFDVVCEICVIHNLVFSHKPVRVPMGYLNIHGHLHTEKMSTLGYQHINAYDSNFFERPMLVDDLIDSAAFQSPEEYAGTDLKHVEEKFEKYTSVENDTYTQIVDLTDMVGLYPVDEAVELPTFKTPEELSNWMKSNVHYANFTKLKSSDGVAESKSGSCHDQVVFEYNALKNMGKKPKILFFIAYKEGSNQGGMTHSLVYYSEGNKVKWFENSWSGMEGIHTYDSLSDLKADIKRIYSNMPDAKNFPELEFKSVSISDFDTGMNLGEFVSGIMDETANDPLDEVLFSDITDVQYWENDDDAPKKKKVKQSPLDTDNQGVVAESTTTMNTFPFIFLSQENMNDELYPEGKMLLRNMDDAVRELYLYRRPVGEYYVHNTEPGYYRIIMSPEFSAGYFSTDTINLSAVGKIRVNADYSWEWIEKYDSDMNESDQHKYEMTLNEAAKSSLKVNTSLYFISKERLDEAEVIHPHIPDNYMTQHGYEDNKTPRVCFSTSIDGCLMGLGKNVSNQVFYVYQPVGKYKVITPTIDQVPDVKITKERWICEPVKLIRVGKIRAIDENGPHDDGIPYVYGKNGEHEARLYHWGWKWIKQFKYDLNESATFNQVKRIVNNIPKEEHHWFYHGDEFKDSPYVKYRDVMYLKNGRGKTIGGFIDVYSFDSDPDTGIVVIALEPGARGTGLATKLVQKALKKLPALGIKKVIWRADIDNIASQKLAKKLGFTDISDLKANPDQYKYEYVLNEMYLNSLSAAVEDTTELHELSPKDKQTIANKYGLRTPGEYQQDGQDKTQERVNQRREKQLKDLKKARKIKKRKAFVRKVKSHLPGAQNESAMGILSMPKVVSSPPFDIDDKVDLYVGLANKKINEYGKTAKNILVPKRKFKKNSNKNRSVPDYYLKLWFNPDRATNLLINDAAPNRHTIWLYPDEYCTLMFVCADGVCRVYMLDSYIAGDYYQFLGSFQVDMGIGVRLKAALKEDSSGVDESESDHYEADATDRDPLWGDRNHFFKHPNAVEEDYDKSIQENYKFELVDKNLRFVDRLDEATTKSQKLYPVYVVLVHSGTGVSKAIKAISHSEYSHASICFDSSLDKMYSFARKDPRNPFIGGFRYESIGKGFYEQKEIPYAVYVVPCTENQVKKMKKRLNYFIQNQEKFTFDFTGLVTNYLGIVNNPAHRWFCSRFVADVLNAGAPKNNPYVAEPSLQDPDDFKDTDWAIYVDSGENLMKYDRKKVDRKTNQILRKEMLRRMTVNESAIFDLDAFNPFIESTLNYQFAMMDEAAVDDFVRYLKSFKVKFDKEGNVIISRREVDQLDKHFRQSLRMIKAYENAGDLDSVKLELCKINYMIELINEYYLSPRAMKSKRVKADLRKEMLDLRSVMLNAFSQHLKYVKTMDPAFNFKSYYDTSIYGKNIEIPKPVLSAIGKAIVTRL